VKKDKNTKCCEIIFIAQYLLIVNYRLSIKAIIMSRTLFVFLFFLFVSKGQAQPVKAVYEDPRFIAAVLKQHQMYREELQLPALSWSPALAKDALAWARHLASIDKGEHDMDVRGKEGENLWWGTASTFGVDQMIDMWGGEKKSFKYDIYPNCSSKRSAVVGHYTQMVWRNTRSIGCAIASNGRMDYLVCRYSSPGNIVGQKPY
jgi:hypothetical protein